MPTAHPGPVRCGILVRRHSSARLPRERGAMGKVVVNNIVSLDGFYADTTGEAG